MDEEYKVSLGVDIDIGDLQSQINKAGDKVSPIPIKVEIENLDDIKKQIQNLGGTKSNAKVVVPIDTSSIENSLREVKDVIVDIKKSIGSLDSGSGLKDLLSSINQITKALGKAEDESKSLVNSLNALANKDFNINFGINMGGSNQIGRNAAYGSKVRNETLPQLKQQVSDLVKYYNTTYKSSLNEFETLQRLVSGTKLNNGDFFENFLFGKDSVASRMNSGSLASQMQAYKQYIDMFKQAASLRGLDISNVTSSFSKSADNLIKDAQDIQTGANEMQEGFEKLRQIFGGNNNLNVEGLSQQLDSIVVDLGEIKTALQGLSSGVSFDGLTQSFDRLSTSIETLIQNCGNARMVINDSVNGLNNSISQSGVNAGSEIANNFDNSMESVQASATETSGVIENLKTTLKTMHFDNSSIDAITKDIEELGFEVTNASVKMKDGNFDITVKGVDSLGRAVTEMRHLDSASGEISGLGRSISQSFSTSDDVIKDLNKEMANFVKLQSQISNMKVKIGNLEAIGGKTNQVTELKRQLEELEDTYSRLMQTFMKKLTANADIVPMDDVARFDDEIVAATEKAENKLRELDAKVADTKAKLAEDIKIKVDTDITNSISKAHSDFDKLSTKTVELKQKLDLLDDIKVDLDTAAANNDIEGLIIANERYEKVLKDVKAQLDINKRAEKDALDATALQQAQDGLSFEMSNWLKKNSAAAKDFGSRIQELQAQIRNCDKSSLSRLRAEFTNIKKEAQLAGKTTQSLTDKIKNQFSKYSQYLSIASLYMYAWQGMRDMFNQVVAIDTAMTELKKVTDETDASYNRFLTNAASRSKELGTTIDGLVESTADFARLGYGFEESQGLAEVANIYAVVGDEINGVEDATKSLISTLAAYKDEASGISDTDFAMDIVDKFNEVSNNFAISSGGIGEAMQRSASSLRAANNTIDESIALITAANTVVGFVPPNIVIY